MLQHSRTTFRMPIRTNVTYDRATRKTPIHVLMEMALNHAPDGRLTREGISSSIRHYRTNFADRTVSHNLTMNDAFVKTTPSGCWALSGAVNRQPSKKERKLRKKLKEAGPVADLPYPISASTSPSNSNITLSPSPPPNISLNHQTPYVDAAQTNGVSTRAASRPSRARRAKPYKRHSATTFTGSQEVATLPSAGPELLPPMQPINPVTSNTGMSMMSG
ncbi:hypothetical protein FRC02_008875 [Tulasnella sp. 418]|nr:hypothetical protein FRC02_008875 [Tulasnella sp. 418]